MPNAGQGSVRIGRPTGSSKLLITFDDDAGNTAGLVLPAGATSLEVAGPAGNNLQIQINRNGAFGVASSLVYEDTGGTIFSAQAQAVGDIPLEAKGFAGQTANVLNVSSSTGTGDLFSVSASGLAVAAGGFLTQGNLNIGGVISSIAGGGQIQLNINNQFSFANVDVSRTNTFSIPGSNIWQLGPLDAATATAQTLQVQNVAAGNANVAGASWTINGSLSNGSGLSGDIIIQTGDTGAASGTQNGLNAALTLKGGTASGKSGSVVFGKAAIATNATDGFIYIPTCAGTPTGTPTAFTGRAAFIFDTTNSQFWIFAGGAWKQPKTPAGAALVTWQ